MIELSLVFTGLAGQTHGARRSGVPGAMAEPTLAAGELSATLTMAAVPADGGSPILRYDYELDAQTGDFSAAIVRGQTADPATPILIAPLVAGSFKARTRAVNAVGAGAWSATASITVAAAAPLAIPFTIALTSAIGTSASVAEGVSPMQVHVAVEPDDASLPAILGGDDTDHALAKRAWHNDHTVQIDWGPTETGDWTFGLPDWTPASLRSRRYCTFPYGAYAYEHPGAAGDGPVTRTITVTVIGPDGGTRQTSTHTVTVHHQDTAFAGNKTVWWHPTLTVAAIRALDSRAASVSAANIFGTDSADPSFGAAVAYARNTARGRLLLPRGVVYEVPDATSQRVISAAGLCIGHYGSGTFFEIRVPDTRASAITCLDYRGDQRLGNPLAGLMPSYEASIVDGIRLVGPYDSRDGFPSASQLAAADASGIGAQAVGSAFPSRLLFHQVYVSGFTTGFSSGGGKDGQPDGDTVTFSDSFLTNCYTFLVFTGHNPREAHVGTAFIHDPAAVKNLAQKTEMNAGASTYKVSADHTVRSVVALQAGDHACVYFAKGGWTAGGGETGTATNPPRRIATGGNGFAFDRFPTEPWKARVSGGVSRSLLIGGAGVAVSGVVDNDSAAGAHMAGYRDCILIANDETFGFAGSDRLGFQVMGTLMLAPFVNGSEDDGVNIFGGEQFATAPTVTVVTDDTVAAGDHWAYLNNTAIIERPAPGGIIVYRHFYMLPQLDGVTGSLFTVAPEEANNVIDVRAGGALQISDSAKAVVDYPTPASVTHTGLGAVGQPGASSSARGAASGRRYHARLDGRLRTDSDKGALPFGFDPGVVMPRLPAISAAWSATPAAGDVLGTDVTLDAVVSDAGWPPLPTPTYGDAEYDLGRPLNMQTGNNQFGFNFDEDNIGLWSRNAATWTLNILDATTNLGGGGSSQSVVSSAITLRANVQYQLALSGGVYTNATLLVDLRDSAAVDVAGNPTGVAIGGTITRTAAGNTSIMIAATGSDRTAYLHVRRTTTGSITGVVTKLRALQGNYRATVTGAQTAVGLIAFGLTARRRYRLDAMIGATGGGSTVRFEVRTSTTPGRGALIAATTEMSATEARLTVEWYQFTAVANAYVHVVVTGAGWATVQHAIVSEMRPIGLCAYVNGEPAAAGYTFAAGDVVDGVADISHWIKSRIVTETSRVVLAGASAPATMSAPTLATNGAALNLTFAAAPSNGGSVITGYEWRVLNSTTSAVVASGSEVARGVITVNVDPGTWVAQTRAVNLSGSTAAWSASSSALSTSFTPTLVLSSANATSWAYTQTDVGAGLSTCMFAGRFRIKRAAVALDQANQSFFDGGLGQLHMTASGDIEARQRTTAGSTRTDLTIESSSSQTNLAAGETVDLSILMLTDMRSAADGNALGGVTRIYWQRGATNVVKTALVGSVPASTLVSSATFLSLFSQSTTASTAVCREGGLYEWVLWHDALPADPAAFYAALFNADGAPRNITDTILGITPRHLLRAPNLVGTATQVANSGTGAAWTRTGTLA